MRFLNCQRQSFQQASDISGKKCARPRTARSACGLVRTRRAMQAPGVAAVGGVYGRLSGVIGVSQKVCSRKFLRRSDTKQSRVMHREPCAHACSPSAWRRIAIRICHAGRRPSRAIYSNRPRRCKCVIPAFARRVRGSRCKDEAPPRSPASRKARLTIRRPSARPAPEARRVRSTGQAAKRKYSAVVYCLSGFALMGLALRAIARSGVGKVR